MLFDLLFDHISHLWFVKVLDEMFSRGKALFHAKQILDTGETAVEIV